MRPYQECVIWGLNLKDYIDIFGLTPQELSTPILDFQSGASSFNAELSSRGGKVLSCDSFYSLQEDEIESTLNSILTEIPTYYKERITRFISSIPETSDLIVAERKKAFELFKKDLPSGLIQKRYRIDDNLDNLIAAKEKFNLALCPFNIFDRSPEKTLEYHLSLIEKLSLLSNEIRFYPLINSKGEIPSLLGPIMQDLHKKNYGMEIKAVHNAYLTNENTMLRIWAQICEV